MPKARSSMGRCTAPIVNPNGSGGLFLYVAPLTPTANPISEGGKWLNGHTDTGGVWNDMQITANGACGAANMPAPNRYDDNIACLNPTFHAFAPNQFVEAVVYNASGYNSGGGSHECETLLHWGIGTNHAAGMELSIGSQTSFGTYVFGTRWNGAEDDFTTMIDPANGTGSYTNAPTPIADGDIIRSWSTVSGGVATYFLSQNGIIIITFTDTVTLSGQPGMGSWPVDGALNTSRGWKTWKAGEL